MIRALGTLTIGGLVVVGLIVLVGLATLRSMINIVQQGQVGVVKRLGEYRKTHEPGLVIIAPFVDSLQTVDMREVPVPGDRQDVITKDNVVVTVNATIFTQVVDAKQALFSVKNFDVAIDALARTALRSVIGTMTLDEALSERERINTDVQEQMEVGHRQVGHPHQPHRDRRDRPAAPDPPGPGPAEAGRPGEAGPDPAVRGRAAVGHQRGRGPVAGRHQGRRGRAPGRHPAGRGHAPGRHPRGRGPQPRPSPPSTAPSPRPTPTRRWWPSCSSTRWPSSPTATTPRSWSPTRAPGSWARPRPCAACWAPTARRSTNGRG